MTVQFVQGVYVESYDPTIEDSYRKQIDIDGRPCDLEILDTAGVAQFTAMRELYIKSGRGFLLVYSVTDENSLKELLSLREQVMRIKDSENVPMALVGNKCDLEEDRVVSVEDGIRVSQEWGQVPFYETSARNRTNIDEVFSDVLRQIMKKEASILAEKKEQKEKNKQNEAAQNASSKNDAKNKEKSNSTPAEPKLTQKNRSYLKSGKSNDASDSKCNCCVIM